MSNEVFYIKQVENGWEASFKNKDCIQEIRIYSSREEALKEVDFYKTEYYGLASVTVVVFFVVGMISLSIHILKIGTWLIFRD